MKQNMLQLKSIAICSLVMLLLCFSFDVKATTKYLGFFVGTKAGAAQWTAPIHRFRFRTQAARAADASVAMNCYVHNSHILPVTGERASFAVGRDAAT